MKHKSDPHEYSQYMPLFDDSLTPSFPNAIGKTTTSIDAYLSMIHGKAALRKKVFRFIYDAGERGYTREELAVAMGLTGSTLRPRVWELLNAQPDPLLVDGPDRRMLKSRRAGAVLRAPCFAPGEDEK